MILSKIFIAWLWPVRKFVLTFDADNLHRLSNYFCKKVLRMCDGKYNKGHHDDRIRQARCVTERCCWLSSAPPGMI